MIIKIGMKIVAIYVNLTIFQKCPKCDNELKEYNGNLHYLECKNCEFKDVKIILQLQILQRNS